MRRPLQRKVERVVGKFDFEGSDSDDLPFKKGEILYIISKDEDQWWTAKNSVGQTGQIPVPYVQRVSFHNFFIELPFLTALICLFQYEDAHQSTIERPGSGGHLSHSLHSDNTLKKNNLNVSFLKNFFIISFMRFLKLLGKMGLNIDRCLKEVFVTLGMKSGRAII